MRKVREITLDNTKRLLKDLGNGILGRHEFKREYNNIADDVETIVIKSTITRNQEKMAGFMSVLKEILEPSKKKSDKQSDSTNMPELEREEFAGERRN